jgi:hypothetical protein
MTKLEWALLGLSCLIWAILFAAAWWHSQPRYSFREELRRLLSSQHQTKGE